MTKQNKQKIPEGWKEMTLGDIGKVSMCKRVFKEETTPSGPIPFYKISTFGSNADAFISEELFNKYKNRYPYPKKGDILISASGTIGRTVVFDGEKAYFQDSNIVWIDNPENQVLNIFLEFVYKRTKWTSTDGGIISRLYNDNLRSIKFFLPPIDEQRRIVRILESWEKYVQLLDQKIKSKKKIENFTKIGLLTGKNYPNSELLEKEKRFFKVPKHWEVVSISSIAKEVSIKNRIGVELPVLSCTKHNGLVDSLKFFKKQIFSKNLNTYKIVSRNEFAYATNHIEEGSIGLQKIYDQALVSPMYTVFKTNENIIPEYLFPLLKTELYRCMFEAATSSSVNRRGSLRWKTFSKIKIPLPPIEEQRKIVSMLHVARQEIETLEKQYRLVTEQRNYLLNNLITGQIRVSKFASHN